MKNKYMLTKFDEFLFESAPRIPNKEDYWLKKGKSGKDVCLIFHDDLDGVTSCIVVKNYLLNHGFKIKKYGVINYNEGWAAFKIDPTLINIALDFADDLPEGGIDVYIDHHASFTEEEKRSQKRYSIKTATGSAAEGIADQLGVPFSSDIKDWIDMVDSAKYDDYNVDIKSILNFDLKEIVKSKTSKLTFAAAMNQLLKRSDEKTFIEVVNSCQEPSIYNIYRLFKIFYPQNNPNFRTGDEADFVEDAKQRLDLMQKKTKGEGFLSQGYDKDGKKIIFRNQQEFWKAFAKNLPYKDVYDSGENTYHHLDLRTKASSYVKDVLNQKQHHKTNEPDSFKMQLKQEVYQIIGNLMYVPSGTWANALRAKAIFVQDVEKGILPDDPKLNIVLLQYGNTLQIADLRTKIKNMTDEDLPKDKSGVPIRDLGVYCESLVENFKKVLGYKDERTVAGGHPGIGSISNVYGKCNLDAYKGVKFIDMFKNKIINDLSGVKWSINLVWSEEGDAGMPASSPDDINKKMMNIEDVRSEDDVTIEKNEKEILNYLIINKISDKNILSKFKNNIIKKIYEIFLETDFKEITSRKIKSADINYVNFKKISNIEDGEIFNKILNKFNLNKVYSSDANEMRSRQRKELKRILKMIFNMMNKAYIKPDTEYKYEKWI